MTPSPAALRPPTTLLASVLAAFTLILAPVLISPAAVAAEPATSTTQPAPVDDDASTAQPTDPAPPTDPVPTLPGPQDFTVRDFMPQCWDSAYHVEVEYGGDPLDLEVALQEQLAGSWTTVMAGDLAGGAYLQSATLDEGESGTFQVIAYSRSAPADSVLLRGPVTATGISVQDCPVEGWFELPEEQWTVAQVGCGTVTFTSRAEEEVVVRWTSSTAGEEDMVVGHVFLAPGASSTVHTSERELYWSSAAGIGRDLEPIGTGVYYAGEGELRVPQDCPAAQPAEPTKPAPPAKPAQPAAPAKPVGGHAVPAKVQTDSGASTGTVALGLALMTFAGLGLVRLRRSA